MELSLAWRPSGNGRISTWGGSDYMKKDIVFSMNGVTGWRGEDLEWLFNYGCPINSAVNVRLSDYLLDNGFDVN